MDPRIRIPRIRIHTKMSCIRNTGDYCEILAIPTVLQVVAALLSLSERKLWSAEIAFTYFKSKINHHI
jgi:hypothetical protein